VADVSDTGLAVYTARITREGSEWLAEVVELDGVQTYAGNLTGLIANINEALGLWLDEPEGADTHPLRLEFVGEDLLDQAAEIARERTSAEEQLAQSQRAAAIMVSDLTAAGYSVRDIAGALGMSPGRVSQINNPVRKSAQSAASKVLSRGVTSPKASKRVAGKALAEKRPNPKLS
jgi:predicted RNase H-like HicB family nuclease